MHAATRSIRVRLSSTHGSIFTKTFVPHAGAATSRRFHSTASAAVMGVDVREDDKERSADSTTTTTSPTTSASSPTRMPMAWNDYFKLRTSRNRVRPYAGIPGALAGAMTVVAGIPFNPLHPLLGIDPAFVMGAGTLLASVIGYQMGAAAGQVLWRAVDRERARDMDVMDRVFFAKVRRYVSERGQSPYVRTVAGMQGTISSLTSAVAKSKASSSAGTSTSTSSAQQQRPDFYGESVRSVADYRAWLRRQQRWSRDHLGADARPIRGVRVGQ